MQSVPETSAGTGWLLLAHRLHYLSALRQWTDEQIPGRKEQSDESQDEHESRQRNVGQLIWRLPKQSRTRAKGDQQGRIPGKEQSDESQDEHESW